MDKLQFLVLTILIVETSRTGIGSVDRRRINHFCNDEQKAIIHAFVCVSQANDTQAAISSAINKPLSSIIHTPNRPVLLSPLVKLYKYRSVFGGEVTG